MNPTIVTYPGGATSETTSVIGVFDVEDNHTVVVTEATPFHPLDPWWPDQPSDRGLLKVAGVQVPVSAARRSVWVSSA
jgi:alanyl-tRNA synthetase